MILTECFAFVELSNWISWSSLAILMSNGKNIKKLFKWLRVLHPTCKVTWHMALSTFRWTRGGFLSSWKWSPRASTQVLVQKEVYLNLWHRVPLWYAFVFIAQLSCAKYPKRERSFPGTVCHYSPKRQRVGEMRQGQSLFFNKSEVIFFLWYATLEKPNCRKELGFNSKGI